MELTVTSKWVLGIVATIFLGALGSGLWSLVFEPLLKKFGKLFLTASTLGLKSMRNAIYAEIAKGHRDRGVKILMLALITATTVPAIIPFAFESRQKLHEEELSKAVQVISKNNVSKQESENKITEELDKIAKARRAKAKTQLLLMSSILVFILMFQFFRIIQIESTISHFERCMNICLPYFIGNEYNEARSAFALINTREDYLNVMGQLETVAKRGNIELPILLLM